MDLATIIGIVGGFTLVIVAMGAGGGLSWFLDAPSAMIVLGGTLGATLINYQFKDLLGVLNVARQAFLTQSRTAWDTIEMLVSLSKHSRRNGLLSLQEVFEKTETDSFLKKSIELVIDGMDPYDIKTILHTEISFIQERHQLGAEIFSSMGNFAPAMGMMGTLIGLVKMLMFMDDPANIGPAMALALVTTFYGVILANLVFLPIAGKLRQRSSQELLIKQLVIQGALSIQAGDNPRILEQKLQAYISPSERKRSGR